MIRMETGSTSLLGGLLYFPPLRRKYNALMQDNSMRLFVPGTVYSQIENIIRLYIKADPDVSFKVIWDKLQEQYYVIAPGNKRDRILYARIMEALYDAERYTLPLCTGVLDAFTKERLVNVLQGVDVMRSIPQILNTLKDVQDKLSTVAAPSAKGMRLYDPLRDQEELMKFRPRISTGIGFIDRITGGGIVFGDHMGILGPSSGGKTILAIQLACNLAIQGHKVLYLQFEQPIEGNIIARVQSYLTGLPIDTFENKTPEMLGDDVNAKLESVRKLTANVRMASFLDQSVSGVKIASADDIVKTIDGAIKQQGFTPRFVVVDWLGACVSSIMRSSNDMAVYQHTAQDLQDTLNDYGKTHDMTMCYMHQTKEDVQAKPSSYKPQKGDGYWFSAFHQKLELCLQLGVATKQEDGTKICWLVNGKSRCTGTMDDALVIRLNGRFARMEETADHEYVISKGGSFRKTSELYNNKPKKGDIFYNGGAADDFVNGYN